MPLTAPRCPQNKRKVARCPLTIGMAKSHVLPAYRGVQRVKNLRRGRRNTTIVKAVKCERLSVRPGPLQELHPQAGTARKILIEGNNGQVAFQGGGRNECVHIPD
jgi:hypothetical protein